MPRFYVEPRPYCLIRAQKQNPFFLARASCHFSLQIPATLCKFRPLQQRELRAATATASRAVAATATVTLSSSLSLLLSATFGEPTTRDHHASLLPPPSRLASSHRRLVSRPATTTRDHHASPLPPSRLASVHHHARPPREPPAAVSSRVRPRCSDQSSLSLSLYKCSGVPPPPREHFRSFCRNCRAAVFFKVNFQRVFV